MPPPSVTEVPVNSENYQITDSKAFIANVNLTINAGTFDTESFTVVFPADVTGLVVELDRLGTPGPPVNLLTVPPGSGVTDGTFQITVDNTPTQLTCNITDTGGGAINEPLELRAKVSLPGTWILTFGDPGAFVRNFVACDPRAQVSAPATGFEQETVTLQADNATVNTVIGTLPASLAPRYRFSHTGTIAITDLPSPVQAASTYDVDLPGVYQPVPVTVSVQTAFSGAGSFAGAFLANTSDAADLTISARPQHIALVLDRSGSMSADGPPTRWDNAVAAARVLTHLFAGSREGVHDEDRIGIVAFEDPGSWHLPPRSASIATLLPMTKLSDAKETVRTLPFGSPGTNTPIGDGLATALDLLAGGSADTRYTIILLTDGFENSGTVHVGPTDPSPLVGLPANSIQPFGPLLTGAPPPLNDANLFVIGLGSTVDSGVLNNLATPNRFLNITDPAQLVEEFGVMLQFSQEINQLPVSDTPPAGITDDPNAVHVITATGAERLVFAVLAGPPAVGTVALERWDPAGAGAWVPQPIEVLSTSTHHASWVSNLTDVTAGAQTTWRVFHLDATDTPVALLPEKVLAYEDLHVKADVLLDRPAYLTGDDMTLTVRIRHDDQPVLKAKVRAELTAPAQGLGEALSAASGRLKIDECGDRRDNVPAAEALIEALLEYHGWDHLPTTCPTGVFEDGTDELHDNDGDGNYTNTFDRVWAEGVYRWQMFIEGEDAKGNFFNRQLAIATFAGVRVDPKVTRVTTVGIPDHPSKLPAVRVIVTPQDVRGQRLGPGKDHVVFWSLRGGVFEHVRDRQPAPTFTDGTYQRVILFDRSERATLRVKANGTVLPTIEVHSGLLGVDRTVVRPRRA